MQIPVRLRVVSVDSEALIGQCVQCVIRLVPEKIKFHYRNIHFITEQII